MTVEVLDFGCRLNIAEGATIARLLGERRDMTVINGCGVTNEAMRQTAQAARRARLARPGARIVVTGCAAQIEPTRFAGSPDVDLVLGNREKLQFDSYAKSGTHVGDIAAFSRDRAVVSGAGQTRAFVEVQTGCDHRCTFCIIPQGRGDSVSIPMHAVVEAVEEAAAAGQLEVVLTGVDLTSYRPSLAALVAEILRAVPALPRLRLSSLDPAEIDDALFELIAHEPRIMPHVHLSLQSGDAMILKRMKRRHTPGQALHLIERLQAARPGIAIGADLIAGFPTEDEIMHANSLAAIEHGNIVFAHIFPYSPRAGTPAARMPQVATHVARARAKALRDASEARRAAWLSTLVGTHEEVLVERSGLRGHAPGFAMVDLTERADPGGIVSARIMSATHDRLTGVAA